MGYDVGYQLHMGQTYEEARGTRLVRLARQEGGGSGGGKWEICDK